MNPADFSSLRIWVRDVCEEVNQEHEKWAGSIQCALMCTCSY